MEFMYGKEKYIYWLFFFVVSIFNWLKKGLVEIMRYKFVICKIFRVILNKER